MPGGDQTGPDGKGPQTGRRLGVCAGIPAAEQMNVEPRRGRTLGLGQGRRSRGCRRGRGRGLLGVRTLNEGSA